MLIWHTVRNWLAEVFIVLPHPVRAPLATGGAQGFGTMPAHE